MDKGITSTDKSRSPPFCYRNQGTECPLPLSYRKKSGLISTRGLCENQEGKKETLSMVLPSTWTEIRGRSSIKVRKWF